MDRRRFAGQHQRMPAGRQRSIFRDTFRHATLVLCRSQVGVRAAIFRTATKRASFNTLSSVLRTRCLAAFPAQSKNQPLAPNGRTRHSIRRMARACWLLTPMRRSSKTACYTAMANDTLSLLGASCQRMFMCSWSNSAIGQWPRSFTVGSHSRRTRSTRAPGAAVQYGYENISIDLCGRKISSHGPLNTSSETPSLLAWRNCLRIGNFPQRTGGANMDRRRPAGQRRCMPAGRRRSILSACVASCFDSFITPWIPALRPPAFAMRVSLAGKRGVEAGVDVIRVSALTHSTRSLDVGQGAL